ncbi:MAG TPA: 2OG-Fe dioxygenase family protein [Burkholderiaceae bacterium]|nr:2OG-Fe dioxygenase family protein [Burkholderiaceae bacterium]
MPLIAPPSPCHDLPAVLASTARQGYAVLDGPGVQGVLGELPLASLQGHWNDLPHDEHLKDGGRYRKRRHASYVIDDGVVRDVPHRAHWQPLDYNALHGGMNRWFAPVVPEQADSPVWRALLSSLARLATACKPHIRQWFVEAHVFRIDTEGGIGRPTPEGAHRDGMDFVAVFLVDRHGIKGGETRVFDAQGPQGQRFTLAEPWSLLWLDDERVVHESTPIQPAVPDQLGWRDTLVITLRRDGFQEPSAPQGGAEN